MGCGIAIANVLLPSFIKEKFPKKMASIMGIYSLVLSISSIMGIALAIPLLSVFDLAGAMFFWAIFSFVALVVYYPTNSKHTPKPIAIFVQKSSKSKKRG